jgi:hypothetical protein
MLRHVALVRSNISDEHQFLQEAHSVTFQNTAFLTETYMKNILTLLLMPPPLPPSLHTFFTKIVIKSFRVFAVSLWTGLVWLRIGTGGELL